MTISDNDIRRRKSHMNSKDQIFEKIKRLIFEEKRPFSYKDFAYPNGHPQEGKYAHGTVRNVFLKLKREGLIELVYRSPQAFYTLAGVKFEKGMTPNYRGVLLSQQQENIIKIFRVNKLDKPAIHDVRLLFYVKGIRNIILNNNNQSLISKIDEKSNKDIRLKDIVHEDIIVKTTVHNTDNVSVMVACSDNPIEIEDPISLSKLTGGLTRVEERLQQEIKNYYSRMEFNNSQKEDNISSIPYHMDWVVKLWHFGHDSSYSYSGELFDITWRESLEIFHVYSKKRRQPMTLLQ
jgi:hypothetical protein